MSTVYTIDTSQGWTSDPVNGTGVKLKWTYPTFLGHRDFRIYLQRSTSSNAAVNTNWPLKPYFQANGISNPVPTPELEWETINTWYIPDSHSESLPNKWNDAMNQKPTINYYYRLIAYYTNQVGTTFKEYDWAPAPLTTGPGQTPQWATQLLNTFTGAPPYPGSVATSSTTDVNGNSYVCGYCRAYGVSFNIFIAKYTSSGAQVWNKVFVPGGGDGRAMDIAIDKDGNIIITGFFVGSITFGGPTFTSGTAGGIFLLKLSSTGSYIWSTGFSSDTVGLAGDQAGFGVSTDVNGNIYVCGSFQSSPMTVAHSDFSGATGSVVLNTTGGQDIVLAKFSSIGSVIWAKKFGSASTSEKGMSVAVEYSTGKCYLTGAFQNTVDFSQGTGTPLVNPYNAKTAIFVASFNTDGASLNSIAFPSTQNGTGIRCVLDQLGNPIISTIFRGNITVGSNSYSFPNTVDVLIIKLTATLVPTWSLHCSNSSTSESKDDAGYGLGVAPNGNIVFCGKFWTTITIGSFVLESTTGVFDSFVAALNAVSGAPVWAHQYSTVGEVKQSQAWQVGFDSVGNMYLALQNTGTINFSPTVSLAATLLQSGGLIKFSP